MNLCSYGYNNISKYEKEDMPTWRENDFLVDGKPRLGVVKFHLGKGSNFDLELIKKLYDEWRNCDEFIVLEKLNFKYLAFNGVLGRELIVMKSSKRGNDVYISRINRRLRDFIKYFRLENNVRGFFITLTIDTKQYGDVRDAWEDIGLRYNRIVTWIKGFLKKKHREFLGIFRVFEATKRGYPHVHLLLFYRGSPVFLDENLLSEKWGSYTKVEAIRRLKGAMGYLLKYLLKSFRDDKYILTSALMWFFGKRSYGISRSLFNLIQSLHNSIFLTNKKSGSNSENGIMFMKIGVFTAKVLQISGKNWFLIAGLSLEKRILSLI